MPFGIRAKIRANNPEVKKCSVFLPDHQVLSLKHSHSQTSEAGNKEINLGF